MNLYRLASSQMAVGDLMSGNFPGHSCHEVQTFPIGFPGVAVVTDLVVQKDPLNH